VTELIATVGKKIAERWLAAIVLPALLYVAVAGWAVLAGHRYALDLPRLGRRLTDVWQHRAPGPGPALVAVAVVLGGAGLAATVATTVAVNFVHPLWTSRGPLRRLIRLRRRARVAWRGRRRRPPNRYLPGRATVIGERFRLIGARVHVQYGVSFPEAWPRIWLVTSQDTRVLVSAAYRRYYADTLLAAWGVLYLPWAVWWWPALPIAAGAICLGYWHARTSSAVLATLVEAVVDIHTVGLAGALGVDLPEGRVTPEEGNRINDILGKRA
jgi:hypothetical protein